jgi:hypothetical protein
MPSNISYTVKQNENSRYYVPTSGKQDIDVVGDMAWTLTPPGARNQQNNKVPYLTLTEYQQSTGQLIASLIYYYRVIQRLNLPNNNPQASGIINADNDPLEVYKLKYFADPTGFKYKLPYFNQTNIKRSNTFGSDENPFQNLFDLSNDIASLSRIFGSGKKSKINLYSSLGFLRAWTETGVSIANKTLPGKIKFENPQSWNDTTPENYSTTFDLFNTGDYDQVSQNRRFCHLISYQNSPSRRNFAIMDPPVIYSLSIPGIANLPVCYVNDLSISNLGNTRMMTVDGIEVLIPEAYRISLSFQSLLLPTRNIMLAVEKGQTVEAFGDTTEFRQTVIEWANKSQEGVESAVRRTAQQFFGQQ